MSPQGALIPMGKTFWLVPLFTVPFSFFSGFAFPLAADLEPSSTRSGPQKMVGAYVWECLGAMAGGLVYTFWLLEKFDPVTDHRVLHPAAAARFGPAPS